MFEWYDFYLYGSLAAIIVKQFFSGTDSNTGFIFALLVFAAGFIVRPFGALVFGRLGDMIGRKFTFRVTIMIMGASTFIVGILPNYATIGITAPIILIVRRIHFVDSRPRRQCDCSCLAPVAPGDFGRSQRGRRGGICGMGLADSVSCIGDLASGLGVDSLVDE